MSLPLFPTFKPLQLAHRSEIDAFTKRFSPYSDFNFVSLISYNVNDAFELALLNDNLAVRFQDYITSEFFYSFLGEGHEIETARTLMTIAAMQGARCELRLIPEQTASRIVDGAAKGIVVTEDPDNFDYIHAVHDLVDLTAAPLSRKRKSIDAFRAAYPSYIFRPIELDDVEIRTGVRRILDSWRDAHSKAHDAVAEEFQAIERCMRIAGECSLHSFGVFIGGELRGFTINEVTHEQHYMAHFGKTAPAHKGISDVLEHETARVMQRLGCTHMNYQQDLGLEGLRRYKRSWRPAHYLKKFTLRACQ